MQAIQVGRWGPLPVVSSDNWEFGQLIAQSPLTCLAFLNNVALFNTIALKQITAPSSATTIVPTRRGNDHRELGRGLDRSIAAINKRVVGSFDLLDIHDRLGIVGDTVI